MAGRTSSTCRDLIRVGACRGASVGRRDFLCPGCGRDPTTDETAAKSRMVQSVDVGCGLHLLLRAYGFTVLGTRYVLLEHTLFGM